MQEGEIRRVKYFAAAARFRLSKRMLKELADCSRFAGCAFPGSLSVQLQNLLRADYFRSMEELLLPPCTNPSNFALYLLTADVEEEFP